MMAGIPVAHVVAANGVSTINHDKDVGKVSPSSPVVPGMQIQKPQTSAFTMVGGKNKNNEQDTIKTVWPQDTEMLQISTTKFTNFLNIN